MTFTIKASGIGPPPVHLDGSVQQLDRHEMSRSSFITSVNIPESNSQPLSSSVPLNAPQVCWRQEVFSPPSLPSSRHPSLPLKPNTAPPPGWLVVLLSANQKSPGCPVCCFHGSSLFLFHVKFDFESVGMDFLPSDWSEQHGFIFRCNLEGLCLCLYTAWIIQVKVFFSSLPDKRKSSNQFAAFNDFCMFFCWFTHKKCRF